MSALDSFPESSAYSQIDPRVCFVESLCIYDRFTGYTVGTVNISILPASIEDVPAYKVEVTAEFTKDEQKYLEKIDGHVFTTLRTARQVLSCDLNGESIRRVHYKSELSEEDNIFVVDDERYRYAISAEKVPVFLGDAAMFVLCRLSVFHSTVGSWVFQASAENDTVEGRFIYEPVVNNGKLSGARAKVDVIGGQGSGFSFLGSLNCAYVLDNASMCMDLELGSQRLWAKKIHVARKNLSIKDSDSTKSKNFDSNIELISKYWNSKVHSLYAHSR